MYRLVLFACILQLVHSYTDIDLSTCDVAKSCLRSPPSCSLTTCKQAVTWATKNDSLEIELLGEVDKTGGYLSIGFSTDDRMGEDSVIGCHVQNNAVVFQPSVNPSGYSDNVFLATGDYPNDYIQTDTTDPSLGGKFDATNGRLYCRFRRKLSKPSASSNNVFDLNSKNYFILLARGPSISRSGLSKHYADGTSVSSNSVNLTQAASAMRSLSRSYPLVKAHGTLMVFSWVTFASIGIVMSRYFKDMWPDDTLCGKAVWFSLHVVCQLMCVICLVVAFIVIFCHVGGYSSGLLSPFSAHPVLGIIVFCLAIINPVMALFRCEPTHPKRPIFNFFHFLVGSLAYILSIPTMMLGLKINKVGVAIGQVDYPLALFIAFVIFQVIVEVLLLLHRCLLSREYESAQYKEDINLTSGKPTPAFVLFKYIIGVVHAIVAIFCGLALVVMIGVN